MHSKYDRGNTEMDRLKNTLESEKAKAKSNESDLFQEIIQLDEKLSNNLLLQNQQRTEIEALREQIEAFEKGRKKSHKSKVYIRHGAILTKVF